MIQRFLGGAASIVFLATLHGQSPASATPVDPVAGILDAFRTHNVVALGEGGHGNEQAH